LFEAVMLYSNWLKPVIGMSDCNWGLLDGMNADGLTVSLAFGGRKISGIGFGIPLIVRYLLETTATVEEAIAKLKTIPVHMTYNLTLADATGNYATVFLAPDREPIISVAAMATNHQEKIEWPQYAKLTHTEERKTFLETINANPLETEETIKQKFLEHPLFNYNYAKSFGTLYTSHYRITERQVALYWQNNKMIEQSFEQFTESIIPVHLPMSQMKKVI
jgi:predicted choloylglycine hydrolase